MFDTRTRIFFFACPTNKKMCHRLRSRSKSGGSRRLRLTNTVIISLKNVIIIFFLDNAHNTAIICFFMGQRASTKIPVIEPVNRD